MPNDVKLQEGHPVDENLRPIKVGGKATAIETAQHGNGARVNGDLEVTGNIKGNVKDVELDLTKINSTDLTIDDAGDITLEVGNASLTISEDGSGHVLLATGTSEDIVFKPTGDDVSFISGSTETINFDCGGSGTTHIQLNSLLDTGDYCRLSTTTHGATTLATVDDDAAVAHLNIEADGHVEFDGCGVGFDLVTPTYDATTTVVDFKTGNKQFVTFDSGNITNLNFHFPATSGNFVCLIKQDGTGSRTVTNYRAYDSAGNAASGSSGTLFAGGSSPTLTTDANHVDIISIFWDADNEIAYAVASLDFQF